jgi:MoaA/NifB/PqqE/SkfB family radical SAM enzyme
VTWACNWRCEQCFYRCDPRLGKAPATPLQTITDKIDLAIVGGLDHAVMVGYGEPSLAVDMPKILDYCHERNVSTSMITNGATGLERFKRFFRQGMDHVHISSHGLDGTLDEIVGSPGAFARQAELKEWLASEELPFRTNVTLQQANYRELPDLAEYEVERGVFHFVFLGFLPHYDRGDQLRTIAVHPAELRPYIEDAAKVLLDAGTCFTIRYQPLCHLSPELWPYVTNSRYVFFDPFEWNYELQVHDVDALWTASKRLGDSVACRTPCNECLAYGHCGGWNQKYAAAFGGADLRPIRDVPDEYVDVWERDGGLFDMNPVNQLSGTIGRAANA